MGEGCSLPITCHIEKCSTWSLQLEVSIGGVVYLVIEISVIE